MPGVTHKSKVLGIQMQNYIIDDMDACAARLNITRSKMMNLAAYFATSVHKTEFEEFVRRNDVLLNTRDYRFR